MSGVVMVVRVVVMVVGVVMVVMWDVSGGVGLLDLLVMGDLFLITWGIKHGKYLFVVDTVHNRTYSKNKMQISRISLNKV